MTTTTATIEAFAARVQEAHFAYITKAYPALAKWPDYLDRERVTVKPGPKYTKVDRGSSGAFMIVNATGEIFGIKGYGVIHRGHRYGTLANVDPRAFLPHAS